MSEEKVIYYGPWESFYVCKKCEHEYGYNDPLHSHWGQPCPYCGIVGILHPPNKQLSRRFCCTHKPSFFEKLIMRKKDSGFYEVVDNSDSEAQADVLLVGRSRGLNTTAIVAGAASII